MDVVLGVDPGCRATGIVLRVGDGVSAFTVLERDDIAELPGPEYVAAVITHLRNGWAMAGRPVVAVEGVSVPKGFARGRKHTISLSGVIGCGIVLGAVLGAFADVVVVPAGGNGSGPKAAYPDELWGVREGPAGTGRLRHCRSAFDVAGAAVKLQRIGARSC